MSDCENLYGTSAYISHATCDIPYYSARVPHTIWYGIDQPFEHTEKTIVRLVKFCDYCDNLQVKGKVKCPFCGAPYTALLD